MYSKDKDKVRNFGIAKLQRIGVKAKDLREDFEFSVQDLYNSGAGYSISELKEAGYPLSDLADYLKEAKHPPSDMAKLLHDDGGFTAKELLHTAQIGITDMYNAGIRLHELIPLCCNSKPPDGLSELKQATSS
jgi:hypothetical protein